MSEPMAEPVAARPSFAQIAAARVGYGPPSRAWPTTPPSRRAAHCRSASPPCGRSRTRRHPVSPDSYVVRRAVLNLSNRDYNHVFRELVAAAVQRPGTADEAVITALRAMQGPHRTWPDDGEFGAALENDPLYSRLYRSRVRILLEALEDTLRTDHTEQLTAPVGESLGSKLTIEHVMPQSWRDNWPPLADDPSEGADRDELVHTLGNLTLVTAKLNPALGNMAWDDKRKWLSEHSLLRLTHGTLLNRPPTARVDDWGATWDEARIGSRAAYLASLALTIWPSAEALLTAPVGDGARAGDAHR